MSITLSVEKYMGVEVA